MATSFWIHGVGVSVLATLLSWLVARSLRDASSVLQTFVFYGCLALGLVVSTWQWVGIWRASAKAKVHALARLLARCCVIASVLHLAARWTDVWVARAEANFDDACRVRILGKPDEAELRGSFDPGASDRLVQWLTAHPSVRTLHVTSRGGRSNEGLRIANLVRERHLRVVVDSHCASACTLVLLAAEQRLARPEGRVGFHRPRANGSDVLHAWDETDEALASVGASQAFALKVKATPSFDMMYAPQRELLAENVLTGTVRADEFVYCPPYDRVEDVRSVLGSDAALAAIRDVDPARFQHLVDDYLAAPVRGETQTKLTERLAAEGTAIEKEAMCHPGLAVAQSMAAQVARLAAVASAHFPDRCGEMLTSGVSPQGLSAEELGDDYQRVRHENIVRSMREPSPQPTTAEDAEARAARDAKLSRATLDTIDGWLRSKRGTSTTLCAAVNAYYRALTELEPAHIVRLLRSCPAAP